MDAAASNPSGSALAKVGVPVVGAAGVLGGAFYLTREWRIVLLLLAGMAIVGVIFLLYMGVLVWSRKRKGVPLRQAIFGNAAATPNSVNEPRKRAQIDNLRKTFEEGIKKFHAAGKDLYSLPWYLVVGAPGSGKTEAIRHSAIPFPNGLQNYLQGTGGTINMHWWFTNDAVILDTAGRIFFEEVDAGTSNEWTAFLKMLLKYRPNCPINGLFLVIDVDSLMQESAEKLGARADHTAAQFEKIQRALGVRFPVYVIITKCDRLVGFREFFENLDNAASQHQIMGWSNPAPLDSPFNATLIDQHMQTVKQALIKRRNAMLVDGIQSDPGSPRRLDHVDRLYEFPNSLEKLASPIRQYLERVFASSEWAPKPLFIRGIYFTSALREGAELDTFLASALGVPADQVSEGRFWEREKSYFLREMLLDKAFKEKGLVTSTGNIAKMKKRRRTMLIGSATACTLILLLVTTVGAIRLERGVLNETHHWEGVSALHAGGAPLAIIDRQNRYMGNESVDMNGLGTPLVDVFIEIGRRAERPVLIPKMSFSKVNVNPLRHEASLAMTDQYVVTPLLSAASRKIQDPNATWSADATAALVELMRYEAYGVGRAGMGTSVSPVQVGPLMKYVLSPVDYQRASAHLPELQRSLDRLYTTAPKEWRMKELTTVSAPIVTGASRFRDYWRNQLSTGSATQANFQAVHVSLQELQRSHDRLRQRIGQLGKTPVATLDEYNRTVKDLQLNIDELLGRCGDVSTKLAKFQTLGWTGERPLAQFYQNEVSTLRGRAMSEFDSLVRQIPEKATAQAFTDIRRQLAEGAAVVNSTEVGQLPKEWSDLEQKYLQRLGDSRAFEQLYRVHERSIKALPDIPTTEDAPVADAWTTVDDSLADAEKQPLGPNPPALTTQASASDIMLAAQDDQAILVTKVILPARRYLVLREAIRSLPQDKDAVGRIVFEYQANRKFATKRWPGLPFTTPSSAPFDDHFHPEAVTDRLKKLMLSPHLNAVAVGQAAARPGAPKLVLDLAGLQKLFRERNGAVTAYLDEYKKYWVEQSFPKISVKQPLWHRLIGDLPAKGDVNPALSQLFAIGIDALERARDLNPESPTTDLDALLAARAKLNDRKFVQMTEDKLDRWRGLPQQARNAVERLLGMSAETLAEEYLVAKERKADPATVYWGDLTAALLQNLATHAVGAHEKEMAAARSFRRFPLGPYHVGAKVNILTDQELVEAQKSIDQLLKYKLAAGQKPPPSSELIERGGRLEEALGGEIFNPILDQLCGQLSAEDQQWLEEAASVAKALSAVQGEGGLQCDIYLVDAGKAKTLRENSKRPDVNQRWTNLTLVQGRSRMKTISTIPVDTRQALGRIDVRQPFEIELLLNPNQPVDKKIPRAEDGLEPWNALRLIYTGNGKMVQGSDGRNWYIEMLADDAGGRLHSLWLELVFTRTGLAPLERWQTLPPPPNPRN